MKVFVELLNDTFIKILLVLLYFPILGFAYILKKITAAFAQHRKTDTFWNSDTYSNYSEKYLTSPY